MSVSRFTPVAVLACGALALPAAAAAHHSAGARAGSQAEVHLHHVARVAARAHHLNRHERVLLRRSRRELRRAFDAAQSATVGAQTPVEVQGAAQADTSISQTLTQNVSLLAKISLDTSGAVQSQAASDLLADVRMQTATLHATITMAAAQAGSQANAALQSASAQASDISLEVNSASTVASSPSVNSNGQASAELAMATGTDAITNIATTVSGIRANVQTDGSAAWAQFEQTLSDVASTISIDVENSGEGGDNVTVDSSGPTTLDTLATLSVQATAASGSSAGESEPTTTSAQGSVQGTVGSL